MIEHFWEALMKAGNLDINQAKTLVYYCIMTWSDEPKIRPIIDLNGESGTGKNGIMKQIKNWCAYAKWINARNMTSAELRDALADTKTALVEEADKTKDPSESENWYQLRYEDTGRMISYRRLHSTSKGRHIIKHETHVHFGYTILHTQNPFETPEMDRRTLRITLYKNPDRIYKSTDGLPEAELLEISKGVDWNMEIERDSSGSAWDVWLPFMRVATFLRDGEYLEYAREQIESKAEEDGLTVVYEPKGVVLSEIGSIYQAALGTEKNKIPITEVRQKLNDRAYYLHERNIVKLAKEIGFNIVYPQGKAHVKIISEAQLREIVKRAGMGKFFFEEGTPAEVTRATPVAFG